MNWLRFSNPRPIRIDKQAIGDFVETILVPRIVRELRHIEATEEPLGDYGDIARSFLDVESVDGKEVLRARVEVRSRMSMSKGKWAAVLGGGASKRVWREGRAEVDVVLYLNGALSPEEWLSKDPLANRLQPLSTCTHETCLAYGLYSILTHELTHAAEAMFYGKKSGYKISGTQVDDFEAYVNDPVEVRAFMQQIVDETVRTAQKQELREWAATKEDRNRKFVDVLLTLSTTWRIIHDHLRPANRAKILRAVHGALDREGLLL